MFDFMKKNKILYSSEYLPKEEVKVIEEKYSNWYKDYTTKITEDGTAHIDVPEYLSSYTTEIFRNVIKKTKGEKIKQYIFYFNCGGGEIAGVQSAADEIKKIEKPTYAFVDGLCASGGYWLACACNKIYATQTSTIGSIGAMVAVDKKNDVEYIVSKGAEDKVSTNSLQELVNEKGDIFVKYVSEMRKIENSYNATGNGGVFGAVKAAEMGLIDEVSNLAKIDDESGNETKKEKVNMTDEQIKNVVKILAIAGVSEKVITAVENNIEAADFAIQLQKEQAELREKEQAENKKRLEVEKAEAKEVAEVPTAEHDEIQSIEKAVQSAKSYADLEATEEQRKALGLK